MTALRRALHLLLFLGLSIMAVGAWVGTLVRILFGEEPQRKLALRGLDQFGNAGLLSGSNYETISSHVGRLMAQSDPPRWAYALYFLLEVLDPGHCLRAAEDEAPILAAIEKVKSQ